MVISETIFKNNELPLNSSLFIFKGRENLCMDTHYLYDEIQGEGDSKTTNYNKFIVPMMVPFELEHEYYYTEYPFPEEGVTRDDVRKVWIDMTKFKKNKPFTDNDYIYPILIGDKSEIRPEYNSIYSLCRLSDEEIQEYIVDESDLMYTFEYQKSFSDTTDKVVKYDFISKHCRERETYSFKLNSLKVIPEDEPYFEMFKTLQTQMTEKTKFYVEYYPTVSYPNNYVEGDEGFDTINPGRDNVVIYIPNIYSKEYVDGEMKITQNINVFAEEGKFIVFLNGTLVNYSVVKTDVPLTMPDGSKKYKRIQLENCSHLLRRREVNNELGNLSVRDDVVTIIYWDGVKYVKLNRDTAYSTAFYSPKLFIDRTTDEGGPVTMVIPTTFYYTAESNNEIKPRRLSDDNCLVVRDGKILRPEVDYKIRDERLLLNSFDEMGILDEELSKLVYDDEEGGIMYDFTRYRNQLSDLADSYINTEVLYFYDENNVEKVFIDRETRDILINEPAIGSVLVKNWKPNDIFIGGTSRIDLEYQTTEPDGLDAIDESSPVYGQKRTRLSVPLTENVASSTEEWTMEEGENVCLDSVVKYKKIDLGNEYRNIIFYNYYTIISKENVPTFGKIMKILTRNKISRMSIDLSDKILNDVKIGVLFIDGYVDNTVEYNKILVKSISPESNPSALMVTDVTGDGNRFSIISIADLKTIYYVKNSEIIDFRIIHSVRMSTFIGLTKDGKFCLIPSFAYFIKQDGNYTINMNPSFSDIDSYTNLLHYDFLGFEIVDGDLYFVCKDDDLVYTKFTSSVGGDESILSKLFDSKDYVNVTGIKGVLENKLREYVNKQDIEINIDDIMYFGGKSFVAIVSNSIVTSDPYLPNVVWFDIDSTGNDIVIKRNKAIDGSNYGFDNPWGSSDILTSAVCKFYNINNDKFLISIKNRDNYLYDGSHKNYHRVIFDAVSTFNKSGNHYGLLYMPITRYNYYLEDLSPISNDFIIFSRIEIPTYRYGFSQIYYELFPIICGEEINKLTGSYGDDPDNDTVYYYVKKPHLSIFNNSLPLWFRAVGDEYLFRRVVSISNNSSTSNGIPDMFIPNSDEMIKYLTDTNVTDEYFCFVKYNYEPTKDSYVSYTIDNKSNIITIDKFLDLGTSFNYILNVHNVISKRKRLYTYDEVSKLKTLSGTELINAVNEFIVYQGYDKCFFYEDDLKMCKEYYMNLIETFRSDSNNHVFISDTSTLRIGQKGLTLTVNGVSFDLSNNLSVDVFEPLAMKNLSNIKMYDGKKVTSFENTEMSVDGGFFAVPETFDTNCFQNNFLIFKRVDDTISLSSINCNYLSSLSLYKSLPSFKKVCRNYDPFRDTNVYRLKVFSK